MSGSFDRVMEERKLLVDQIIENMKQGYILPKPRWDSGSFSFHNPISHASYKGVYMLKLWQASAIYGYEDTRFMTFKQAQSKGYRVKKGEKGIRLEKYIFEKQVEQKNPDTGKMEKVMVKLQRPMVNTFVVFNASQIEGIPPVKHKVLEHNEIMDIADRLIASSKCPVYEKMQEKAFYSPKEDSITLPQRNNFINQEAFTTTLIHEMVHSTGHESRLNRPMLNRFGTPDYAKEELRAELGAFFMGTDLGIEGSQELLDSHTEYLESWIKALEDDPNELFRACSDAQNATQYLTNNYEKQLEMEKTAEQTSKEEILINRAMGHPDLSATQAARRMLVKEGMMTEGQLIEKAAEWDANVTVFDAAIEEALDTANEKKEVNSADKEMISNARDVNGAFNHIVTRVSFANDRTVETPKAAFTNLKSAKEYVEMEWGNYLSRGTFVIDAPEGRYVHGVMERDPFQLMWYEPGRKAFVYDPHYEMAVEFETIDQYTDIYQVNVWYNELDTEGEELPIGEEEYYRSEKAAMKAKEEWLRNPDVESVDIELIRGKKSGFIYSEHQETSTDITQKEDAYYYDTAIEEALAQAELAEPNMGMEM